MGIHQTFFDRGIAVRVLIQVEDHRVFFLRRGCHTQVYLRGYLCSNLLTGTIFDGNFPVLVVDRDDAAIGEHVLGELAFAHEF